MKRLAALVFASFCAFPSNAVRPPSTPSPITGAIASQASAGTAYTLTNTAAAADFGTTDPVITIPGPGTYLIMGSVNVLYNAATFAANRTVTLKFRRTNNTAADIGVARTFQTRIITAITDGAGTFQIPNTVYTTRNSNDSITIFADVSVLPTAGSIQATQAEIFALRIK